MKLQARHLAAIAVALGLLSLAAATLLNLPALRLSLELWAGNQRFVHREYGAALRHYSSAATMAALDARPHIMAGEVLREGGQLDRAVQEYRIALDLNPSDFEALLGLGRALIAQHNPAAASRYLAEASAARVGDTRVQMELAEALAARGDFRAARDILEAVAARVSREAESPPAGLGESPTVAPTTNPILDQRGNSIRARAHLLLALIVAPEDPRLAEQHLAKGASAALAGYWKPAADARPEGVPVGLRSALALHRRDATATASYAAALGYSYLQADWLIPARAQLERAIALKPDYGDAVSYLGYVFLRQQLFPEALDTLDRARTLQPSAPLPYYLTGLALREQRRFDEAVAALRVATTTAPGDGALWRELARMLVAAGDYPSAADSYEEALVVAPDDAQLLLDVASFYVERLFRIDRGYELAEQSRAAMPGDLRTEEVWARALQVKGDLRGAIGVLEKAALEHPDVASIALRLADVYQALGNRDAAARQYQRAIDLDVGRIGSEAQQHLDSLR